MVRRTSTPGRAMAALTAAGISAEAAELVSGNGALAASASIFKPGRRSNPETDRTSIAKPWQVEAYRHVNICGEARYAATLFAAIAGRAEVGISEPQTLRGKATWVSDGPEVEALAELAPTVRERTKLIRDYMIHRVIAGESYLIARKRVDTDPGYIPPPDFEGTWVEYQRENIDQIDPLSQDFDGTRYEDPNEPIWEIVAVTELQKNGENWKVRHDNGTYVDLDKDDPVIRMWCPDPEDRREAWSPFRSLLPTLREIEWLTMHIFTQVQSRLLSAGVWFLPENLTYPPPPPNAVEGGADAIATMNDAEKFMASLAAAGMQQLAADEVSFPTIVMADPAALAAIDQNKLIKFWSEIDDKAMTLRSSAVRRFALGMDLPPEQVLGSSGLAVDGSGGSAGSVNHWGVWANEEQTISAHVEPALDDFVGTLTWAFLRSVVPSTVLVVAYDTATLRLRQDRSKEALEWYDRGVMKASVALRENGFDPDNDMMNDSEFKRWLLVKIAGGSATPEQVNEALRLLGVILSIPEAPAEGGSGVAPGQPGRNAPRTLEDHPYEGPPRVQHDQTDAPFSALHASCEVLVLRAMEKQGNRLLNDGKRGKNRDRTTPPHRAHLTASLNRTISSTELDFGLAPLVLSHLSPSKRGEVVDKLAAFTASLYNKRAEYSREALIEAMA